MINFRQKVFGRSSKTLEYIKKHPTLPLSAASLAVSGTGLAVAERNRREGREDRREQIRVMKNLNNTLTKVDKHIDTSDKSKEEKIQDNNKNLFNLPNIFRQKNSSDTLDYALKGAYIGGSITGLSSLATNGFRNVGIFKDKLPKLHNGTRQEKVYEYKDGKSTDKYHFETKDNKEQINKNHLLLTTYGVLFGAALGAVIGGIRDLVKYDSRRNTNNRLLNGVVDNLKRLGHKQDSDFTLNPKMADQLKTKICVVVNRVNEDLKLVINTVNDAKLKTDTDFILKNLPKSFSQTEKLGDRFNELTITTISDKNQDPAVITGILDQFIHKGYPVYVVEVG